MGVCYFEPLGRRTKARSPAISAKSPSEDHCNADGPRGKPLKERLNMELAVAVAGFSLVSLGLSGYPKVIYHFCE